MKEIISKCQALIKILNSAPITAIDWQKQGETLVKDGVYQVRMKLPEGSPQTWNFHELLALRIQQAQQVGQDPFVHRPFAIRWIGEFNGLSLQYASAKLKKDKQLVLKAVQQNGLALQWASPKVKDDEEVVEQAVKENVHAIQFASDRIQQLIKFSKTCLLNYLKYNTRPKAILEVIKTNALAIKHVPISLKKKRKFIEEAILLNSQTLAVASKKFKKDESFVLKMVKAKPEALASVSDEFKKNRNFFSKALQNNRNIYPWIPEEFGRDFTLALLHK